MIFKFFTKWLSSWVKRSCICYCRRTAIFQEELIPPFVIIVPCIVIFLSFYSSQVKAELIDGRIKGDIASLNNIKQSSAHNIIKRVSAGEACENLGYKFNISVSPDCSTANIQYPETTDNSSADSGSCWYVTGIETGCGTHWLILDFVIYGLGINLGFWFGLVFVGRWYDEGILSAVKITFENIKYSIKELSKKHNAHG